MTRASIPVRLANSVLSVLNVELRPRSKPSELPFPECTQRELALIRKFAPYTITGPQRQWTLLKALEYLDSNALLGDIVECGVWRGGNMMMVKEARKGHEISRRIFLFDTFSGMSLPTAADVSALGERASDFVGQFKVDLESVKATFKQHGLLGPDVHFVKGKVEDTLVNSSSLPSEIALLRIDTDWYESTKVELETLYPKLVKGGVLIIDDYGHWEGSRRATDEFFSSETMLLLPIDYACRMGVKLK